MKLNKKQKYVLFILFWILIIPISMQVLGAYSAVSYVENSRLVIVDYVSSELRNWGCIALLLIPISGIIIYFLRNSKETGEPLSLINPQYNSGINRRFLVLIIAFIVIYLTSNNALPKASNATSYPKSQHRAYYGFYPSEKGTCYKTFKHNIFGFSIDIPSNWVFGVNGEPPSTVVLIYPEGMITNKFTDYYETIEIGQLPVQNITLEQAQQMTMLGMNQKHSNITGGNQSSNAVINGNKSISWIFQWQSQAGYTVVEYITLVQGGEKIRSVAVRTARKDFDLRLQFYDNIVHSFKPCNPAF